jgi:hypothetical protein
MQVGGGVGVGSAPVPPSGSGSELLPSARCSLALTIILIITRTATTATRPPQLTIHQWRIISIIRRGRQLTRRVPAHLKRLTRLRRAGQAVTSPGN